jgi:hypothetical protein
MVPDWLKAERLAHHSNKNSRILRIKQEAKRVKIIHLTPVERKTCTGGKK